jgi:DNA invertase Pin-like site-specific DNA recombinase
MNAPTEKRNYLLHGEAHPNARLTRAQVVEIRAEGKVPGTSRAWLAKRYGVSRTTVDNIVRGVTWKEAL